MMNVISIRDYGAKGDGLTLDTVAIQAAIDACTAVGGGTVYLPPGEYLSGTITLKDNVTLHVGPNARLLGSTFLTDYPRLERPGGTIDYLEYLGYCLINAYRASHIALTGEGCVDGQGMAFRMVLRITTSKTKDSPPTNSPSTALRCCASRIARM